MGNTSTAYRLYSLGGKQSIDDQIRDCAKQYLAKMGKAPNLCLIHKDLLSAEKTLDDIRVIPSTGLLHFDIWLAVAESTNPTQLELPL